MTLCPEVNYDCHCANFHGTYACSATFKRIPVTNLTKIRQNVQSLILSDGWTDQSSYLLHRKEST